MKLSQWLTGLRTSLYADTSSNLKIRKRIGAEGERLASAYLRKRGWKIVTTNHRFGRDELDILAMPPNRNLLVVVEVRSTTRNAGNPESTLSNKKRRAMVRVARRLQSEAKKNKCLLRFDLITVRMFQSKPEIRHYEGILPIQQ